MSSCDFKHSACNCLAAVCCESLLYCAGHFQASAGSYISSSTACREASPQPCQGAAKKAVYCFCQMPKYHSIVKRLHCFPYILQRMLLNFIPLTICVITYSLSCCCCITFHVIAKNSSGNRMTLPVGHISSISSAAFAKRFKIGPLCVSFCALCVSLYAVKRAVAQFGHGCQQTKGNVRNVC